MIVVVRYAGLAFAPQPARGVRPGSLTLSPSSGRVSSAVTSAGSVLAVSTFALSLSQTELGTALVLLRRTASLPCW